MKNKKFEEYRSLDFYNLSKDIIKFWKKNQVFEKSIKTRDSKNIFSFYEGPPSANGLPGIHHVMARTVKDIFCRYKTLKGFRVYRKGGWDTHGLPVELQVEKKLDITKDDIGEKISIEDYNKECKKAVMKFKNTWESLTEGIGFWVDIEDAYITFENNYIESVWWSLKKLHEKKLLYKGYTIQPFSPAAGTGLSSHELNMPGAYKTIKDTSITAQFKLVKNENSKLFKSFSDDIFFLAWTTTPWTLPANNSLAVGRKIDYVLIETFNKYVEKRILIVIAESCIPKFFKEECLMQNKKLDFNKNNLQYKVLKKIKGSELLGMDYEQLMPYVKLDKPAFTIIHGDFVSTEEGTGIVHISLTFGSDDFFISKKNNVSGVFVKDIEGNQVPIVNKSGKFVKEITDFAGLEVKTFTNVDGGLTTDEKISIKLKEENRAFDVRKYEHSYPHCWRTDKPILYYPLESWFINTTKLKNDLIKSNKKINWQPPSTGSGRFGNWLENLVDWNLSRSRFWGTPLPIWRTEDGLEEICIGSIEELRDEVKKSVEKGYMKNPLTKDFDLHRPYVDDIILVSKDNKPMLREKDIIDVWYDSGSVPFAQYHYPFENKDFFKSMFPASFIAEGVDQTRGWFFTLHAISIMLFGKSSFKNVISNGLVLDKLGNKMSKRLGNAVDPFEIIKKYGPDATRWYMIINSNPWDNLKFDEESIKEVLRKFFGTLTNTYNFFSLYANIDGFRATDKLIPYQKRSFDDRWIISRLNTISNEVDNNLDTYNPTRAARLINDFINDDLSNWYVRLNRKRFWMGDFSKDKLMAYQTLHECLEKISIISSPFIPFYSEKLFLDLNRFTDKNLESVHLSLYPKADKKLISDTLERRMLFAQKISSLVHSIRKKEKIKVRQPLSKIIIPINSSSQEKDIKYVENIILSEVNVKNIEYVYDNTKVFIKKIKPNYKEIGSLFGPKTGVVSKAILSMNQNQIASLEKKGSLIIKSDDGNFDININHVEITFGDLDGKLVASNDLFTIALDISLTDELISEGLSREFINKIQNERKNMLFDVTDKINIEIAIKNIDRLKFIDNHKKFICNETQANSIKLLESISSPKEMVLSVGSSDSEKVILSYNINKL
tara:strand:- start:1301 stop:4648 length:3348 start_codon:yes stop_codon:yes gene_type:complete